MLPPCSERLNVAQFSQGGRGDTGARFGEVHERSAWGGLEERSGTLRAVERYRFHEPVNSGESDCATMSGMAEFATVYGYLNFERSVKQQARYIHDEETRAFLKTLIETSEARRKTLQKDQILWRAQRGFERRVIQLENDEIEDKRAYPR